MASVWNAWANCKSFHKYCENHKSRRALRKEVYIRHLPLHAENPSLPHLHHLQVSPTSIIVPDQRTSIITAFDFFRKETVGKIMASQVNQEHFE